MDCLSRLIVILTTALLTPLYVADVFATEPLPLQPQRPKPLTPQKPQAKPRLGAPRAPLSTVPATRRCEVRGTVNNIPSYLKLKINLMDRSSGVGSTDVPPNTVSRSFRFANLQCTNPPNPQKSYSLHYVLRRHYGLETAPSWARVSGSAFEDTSYGLRAVVSETQPVFTDVPRYFHNLVTTGILIRRFDTDKPSYVFGDVIQLNITAVIKGATLPGGLRSQDADYRITVSAGGFSQEVQTGHISVQLGRETRVTVPIHHTQYSRGSTRIELTLTGNGYTFRHAIVRNID